MSPRYNLTFSIYFSFSFWNDQISFSWNLNIFPKRWFIDSINLMISALWCQTGLSWISYCFPANTPLPPLSIVGNLYLLINVHNYTLLLALSTKSIQPNRSKKSPIFLIRQSDFTRWFLQIRELILNLTTLHCLSSCCFF